MESTQVRKHVWEHYIGLNRSSCRCFCCSQNRIAPNNFQIVPLQRNEQFTLDNIRPVCQTCANTYQNSPYPSLLHLMQAKYYRVNSHFYGKITPDSMDVEYPFTCPRCRHSEYAPTPLLRCPSCRTPVSL